MPPAHRETDERFCGAQTIVTGQFNYFINNKLAAVEQDIDTHSMIGQLIAANPRNFFINNKPIIAAMMDKAMPDAIGLLMHPTAPTDPAKGSPNFTLFGGMAGGGLGNMGGMLGGVFGQMTGLNIGELASIGNFGNIGQFANMSSLISNFSSVAGLNFGNLGGVIQNFSGFGNISAISGVLNQVGPHSLSAAATPAEDLILTGTVKNFIVSGGSSAQLILQNVKGGVPTADMTVIGHDTGAIFTFSSYSNDESFDNGYAVDYSDVLEYGIACDTGIIALDQYFTGKPSQDYQKKNVVFI